MQPCIEGGALLADTELARIVWVSRPANLARLYDRRMADASGATSRQEFVLAVREQHHGQASEAALQARQGLAEEYLMDQMADEAIEVLVGAVIDAGRLYGPGHENTISTRLRLGDAYLAGDRLLDAYGIHWNLLAEVEGEYGLDAPLAHRVRAAAMRTEELLDAKFDPLA